MTLENNHRDVLATTGDCAGQQQRNDREPVCLTRTTLWRITASIFALLAILGISLLELLEWKSSLRRPDLLTPKRAAFGYFFSLSRFPSFIACQHLISIRQRHDLTSLWAPIRDRPDSRNYSRKNHAPPRRVTTSSWSSDWREKRLRFT